MFQDMEPVELEHDGTLLRGYAARPGRPGPSPTVLVMHSALGVAHEITYVNELGDVHGVVLRQQCNELIKGCLLARLRERDYRRLAA